MPTLAELLQLQNSADAYVGYPQLQRQAARMRMAQQGRIPENLQDPRTYGFVKGLLGTTPDELGMSVLSPNTAAAKEAAYYGSQLSNLAQMTPAAMPAVRGAGRLAGEAINEAMVYGKGPLAKITPQPMRMVEDFSYRGSHKAPGPDFGAPLHDLTGGGQMYPSDVYSASASRIYGTGYPKADREAFDLAKRVRGNPDAEVTMYRAVPKDEKITSINKGDWVTLSKNYAQTHGESVLGDNYKIISKKVKAKDLWTNADSIHEFGYHPND
jgi:hypothetical protein